MCRALLVFLLLMGLAACSTNETTQQPAAFELPYRAWEIGLIAPNYMEVWVESVDVIDQGGFVYKGVHGGTSSIQNPPENR